MRKLNDEGGASVVYSPDGTRIVVGHGQMHASLREDPRVHLLEDCDARQLDHALVGEPVSAIVADVSFISLTKVLPAAFALAAPGAWLIGLVKTRTGNIDIALYILAGLLLLSGLTMWTMIPRKGPQ